MVTSQWQAWSTPEVPCQLPMSTKAVAPNAPPQATKKQEQKAEDASTSAINKMKGLCKLHFFPP
jgi:hypothetical protein